MTGIPGVPWQNQDLLSGLGKAFSCQVMTTVGCKHGVNSCSWAEGRAGDAQKAGGMSLSILSNAVKGSGLLSGNKSDTGDES